LKYIEDHSKLDLQKRRLEIGIEEMKEQVRSMIPNKVNAEEVKV